MIEVTCAIIRNEEGRVLVVQRGDRSDHPFKWEFPGGKIRKGESDIDCVIREINEELSMNIIICSQLEYVEHDYGQKQIKLIPFVCETLQENPSLNEHVAYRWALPDELREIDFQEADVKVMEQYLKMMDYRGGSNYIALKQRRKSDEKRRLDEAQIIEILNSITTLKEVDWLSDMVHKNQEIFNMLLEYSLQLEERLAVRASWVLTKVCEKYPGLIRQHLPGIISQLNEINNDSVSRSFMRILSCEDMRNFGEEEQALLTDYCLGRLNARETPVAIKSYAMEILYKLTLIYPELGNEVAESIRINMEGGTPGIISKGRNVLRKIIGITGDSLSRKP